MNPLRDRLLISADKYESLVEICAFVVFVGLVFEVVEVWRENRGARWYTLLIKLIPTTLITVGVFGEFWFGWQAQKLSAQIRQIDDREIVRAQKETVEAKTLLANTQIKLLEMQKQTAPRWVNFNLFKFDKYLDSNLDLSKIEPPEKAFVVLLYKPGVYQI